eukprot:TRINITY_DN10391_c2_g1_i1.p1 TRINITY_DN10391_c2_g1~~TRINITY_DN10391_c2_g1_i1.p1  ORF type:complete len:668 (+),score=105.50 TRINITY_DN10391_c2_g1_i1:46-2004(+)
MVSGQAWRGGGAGPLPASIAKAGLGDGSSVKHRSADKPSETFSEGGDISLAACHLASDVKAAHPACIVDVSAGLPVSSPSCSEALQPELPSLQDADDFASDAISVAEPPKDASLCGATEIRTPPIEHSPETDAREELPGQEARQLPSQSVLHSFQPSGASAAESDQLSAHQATTTAAADVQVAVEPDATACSSPGVPNPASHSALKPNGLTTRVRAPQADDRSVLNRAGGSALPVPLRAQRVGGLWGSCAQLARPPMPVETAGIAQMRWSFSEVITPRHAGHELQARGATGMTQVNTCGLPTGSISPATPMLSQPQLPAGVMPACGASRCMSPLRTPPCAAPPGVGRQTAMISPRRSMPVMSRSSEPSTVACLTPSQVPQTSTVPMQARTPVPTSAPSTPQGPFPPQTARSVSPLSVRGSYARLPTQPPQPVPTQRLGQPVCSGTGTPQAPVAAPISSRTSMTSRMAARPASLIAPTAVTPPGPAVPPGAAVTPRFTAMPSQSFEPATRPSSGCRTPSKTGPAPAAASHTGEPPSVTMSVAARARMGVAVNASSAATAPAGYSRQVGMQPSSLQPTPAPGQHMQYSQPGISSRLGSTPQETHSGGRRLWKAEGKAVGPSPAQQQEKDESLTSICVKLQHKLGKLSTKKTIAL